MFVLGLKTKAKKKGEMHTDINDRNHDVDDKNLSLTCVYCLMVCG